MAEKESSEGNTGKDSQGGSSADKDQGKWDNWSKKGADPDGKETR